MKNSLSIIFVVLGLALQINGQAYHMKFRQNPEDNHSCIILEDEFLPKYRGFETDDENEFKFSSKPAIKTPTDTMIELTSDARVVEVFAKAHASALAFLESQCKTHERVQPFELGSTIQDIDGGHILADPEIRKIVDGGDQSNRIDVVFMGDGYTAQERELFFSDMQRLTTEMFEGVTFKSYLPVFNIWAIYVESVDSGIGYNGPKNTPFQLYRESGQLRGIFPGNAQNARRICALTGTSGCDYPSIIGNDDFYGGLGGEFVISTKSARTGTTVLRHEMGHNFVDVGEEYDNGQVYSGVNAARSIATLGWTSWLTGEKREERAIYRLLQYPWADLSKGAQSFTFNSDGNYNRWYLLTSVSAAGEQDSLEFILDGKVLEWQTTGFDDREFYSWSGNEGFSAGQHNFTVRTKTNPTNPDIPRMICSITLHEFGTEDEFVEDNNHVSAYPTWDVWRIKTFRPTNAGCLMRNMTHETFCPVCQEGMWMQFMNRISLIDNITQTTNADGVPELTVNTLKLGQLRPKEAQIEGEKLEVKWLLNGAEQVNLRDNFTIPAIVGTWTAEVHFVTSEVRNDPRNLLTSTETVVVSPI